MTTTLLRQNNELRKVRVWNWTIPAGPVTLDDGRRVNGCPNADGCLALCYARVNSYNFKNVKAAHIRNMTFVLDDLDGWTGQMIDELAHRRHRPNGVPRADLLDIIDPADQWATEWATSGGSAVRIHDAGDFMSDEYLMAWLHIATVTPDVLFYAYTKEVSRFRRLVEGQAPVNFRWLYSLGGKEDHLIDLDDDRHAEVFTAPDDLTAAGYVDQEASDLLAVLYPCNRIGITANNITSIRRKMDGQSFGQIQRRRDQHRTNNRPT
jgi:hypothetical protein